MVVVAVAKLESLNYSTQEKNKRSSANDEKGPMVNMMWIALLEVGSIFFGLTSTLA